MRSSIRLVMPVFLAMFVNTSIAEASIPYLGNSPRSTRTWVFFRDKACASPAAREAAMREALRLADPAMLDRRSRRRTEPGLLDDRDLPVAGAYVSAVEQLGARVHQSSRWLNAVSVEATPEQLAGVRTLPFVDRTQPVLGGRRHGDDGLTTLVPAKEFSNRDFYGLASAQNGQVGLPPLHNAGITGAVIIGILDTGFQRTHRVFNQPGHVLNVIAERDFINNDGNTGIQGGDHPDQHVHGTLILSVIASYLPNEFVGAAYGVSGVVLAKTEDITSETPIEEDNYVAGLEFIEAHGADVATSSLGYIDWYTQSDLDGQTAVTTLAVNIATANGLICCTAAGNEGNDGNPGTSHLIAPADALKVITCGAADEFGNIAGFSSDGPTADGRVKPEILARGVATYCIWPYDDVNYAQASGTSLSTPIIAGVAACLAQAGRCWSVDRVRDALFTSASDFVASGTTDPFFIRGYGMANAFAAYAAGCPADYNGDGFVSGDDFDTFVADFEAGTGACVDINGDGFVTGDDFDLYVSLFEAGC